MLGKASEEDLCFLADENAHDYVSKLQANMTLKPKLLSYFPHADPEILKVLKGLLEFNPHFRMTAKEALKSKFFDNVRHVGTEKAHVKKIR